MTDTFDQLIDELVALANMLGDPANDLAILAEGNASARADDETFYVKASGFSMRTIGPEGFVSVRFAPILEAMRGPALDDAQVRQLLSESRSFPDSSGLPSVETFMHAYLLTLPGVSVVGHTHPTPLIALLGLEGAEMIALQRIFPDEIVCCGPASCFVPYVDPGLPLALAIRESVEEFVDQFSMVPKTIWLQNHGLIALGRSNREIESATLMSAKAARIWLAALGSGQPLRPLTDADIDRIHTRPDEHHRQRLLWDVKNK
jgi:rhamnose utilization protein RhaD (predicted bifunctional aldolase and dehydrogenase)